MDKEWLKAKLKEADPEFFNQMMLPKKVEKMEEKLNKINDLLADFYRAIISKQIGMVPRERAISRLNTWFVNYMNPKSQKKISEYANNISEIDKLKRKLGNLYSLYMRIEEFVDGNCYDLVANIIAEYKNGEYEE